MSRPIKECFDTYLLLVLPADKEETPITHWRIDVISPDIRKEARGWSKSMYPGRRQRGEGLDRRELSFRNDKRPATQFMSFRFIMGLVRIRKPKRSGWQDV